MHVYQTRWGVLHVFSMQLSMKFCMLNYKQNEVSRNRTFTQTWVSCHFVSFRENSSSFWIFMLTVENSVILEIVAKRKCNLTCKHASCFLGNRTLLVVLGLSKMILNIGRRPLSEAGMFGCAAYAISTMLCIPTNQISHRFCYRRCIVLDHN